MYKNEQLLASKRSMYWSLILAIANPFLVNAIWISKQQKQKVMPEKMWGYIFSGYAYAFK